MQFFIVDATIFLKNYIFFAFENMKKLPSKVAHNRPIFFSIANWPKTSPNLLFCSIKMAPCAISI